MRKIISILLFVIFSVNSQFNNTTTFVNTSSEINNTLAVFNASASPCLEAEDITTCITKPRCCFVKTSWSIYDNTGCIDVFDPSNYAEFCSNVHLLSELNDHYVNSCECMGYTHLSAIKNAVIMELLVFLLMIFY